MQFLLITSFGGASSPEVSAVKIKPDRKKNRKRKRRKRKRKSAEYWKMFNPYLLPELGLILLLPNSLR